MIADYADKQKWNKMSLMNIASAGYFAADRSIEEYAQKFWNLKKITGNK
jgi:starch phosphorylase